MQNATYARLLAGGLTLALAGFGIWAIIDLRDLLDRLLNFDLTHTTTFIIKDYADVTEFVLTVSVAAVAALLAAAYVTVAASVWRTTRWPRIVRAVLTPARAGGPNR